jgi:hypothetical protein
MTKLGIARIASALAFLALSGAASAQADASGRTSKALSVSVTVLSSCSVEANDTTSVSCESTMAPRVEQSGVYTLQIDGQQARFTTSTINF